MKMHTAQAIHNFERHYDSTREDRAVASRGEFLDAFPLKTLPTLTIKDYVIGSSPDSFCAHVEPRTRAWASIQGSTAQKFGIYFGKTKYDLQRKYHFVKRFGDEPAQAFKNVRQALLELVKAGRAKDFATVDENPLTQMFKAKILSLYFPELYLNVCSEEMLEELHSKLELAETHHRSEMQHLLLFSKYEDKRTKSWSNPKYMIFLFITYLNWSMESVVGHKVTKPKSNDREVDFDKLDAARRKRGKQSERYALKWEKARLKGDGRHDLIRRIKDLTNRPAYGYDFESFTTPKQPRYIEVKSVGKGKQQQSRFYLTANELKVARSETHLSDYYFYLVFYGVDGKPKGLEPKRAADLLPSCELDPSIYIASFELVKVET